MGVRSFTKGVKDSYKTHLAPAVATFKDDVSERAKAAKIEVLETKLAEAKKIDEPETTEDENTTSHVSVVPVAQE